MAARLLLLLSSIAVARGTRPPLPKVTQQPESQCFQLITDAVTAALPEGQDWTSVLRFDDERWFGIGE